MKKMIFLMLLSFLGITASMNAQVSIGTNEGPKPGALLDLSQSGQKLGLILPNVSLSIISAWQLDDGDGADASGTVVFNTNSELVDVTGVKVGKGIFVWTGSGWQAAKSGAGGILLLNFDLTPNSSVDIWERGTQEFTVSGFQPNNDMVAKSVKWVIPANQATIAAVQSGYTGTTCVVKGLTPGTATLVVTSLDENVEQYVTIHVKEVVLKSFDLDKTTLTLLAGYEAGTIIASNFIGSDDLEVPAPPVTWTLTGSTGTSTVTETETTYTVDASTVIPADEAADLSWSITASAGDVENAPVTVNVALWPAALLLPNEARDHTNPDEPGDVAKDWNNPSNTELSGLVHNNRTGVAAGKSLMVSQFLFGKYSSVRMIVPTTNVNGAYPAPADTISPGSWAEMVKHCADSNEGGFTDWYWPGWVEMEVLYNNKLVSQNRTDRIGHSSELSATTLSRFCPSCGTKWIWQGKNSVYSASRCVRRY